MYVNLHLKLLVVLVRVACFLGGGVVQACLCTRSFVDEEGTCDRSL